MARIVRQTLPKPPAIYDQAYIADLADAVNEYMFQREAPGEVIAARFIMVAPLHIPDDQATTAGLPTGMLVLKPLPGQPAGTYYLTVVSKQDVK